MALIGEEPGLLGKVRVVFGKLQMAPRGETHIVFRLSLAIMLSRGCVWVCGFASFQAGIMEPGTMEQGQEQEQEETKVEMPMPKRQKQASFSSFKAPFPLRMCVF